MLELQELRLRYIGRFVEEQIIPFSELGNFIQVDGQNKNTKGSSGSGKTTLFNALDYLLGLNQLPATVLQSRSIINPNDEPIWVQGTFLLDGEKMVMTRTKGSFEIELQNNTKKNAKAEEELVKILGMPADLFRKIIHKRQKEGGFFLNLKPGEMHDFLMDCCGLSPFKKHYETIETKIKRLDKLKTDTETNIQTNRTSLSSMQDAILALGLVPIQDMQKEVIFELKEKHDRSKIRLIDVKTRLETELRSYSQNRPSTANVQHDANVREDLEKKRKEIEAEMAALLEAERERQETVKKGINAKEAQRHTIHIRLSNGERAKTDAAKIATEIKSIRAQTCPTCEQEWKVESARKTEQAKLQELIRLKEFIDDANRASFEKSTLDEEVNALKSRLTPIICSQLPILNEDLANITKLILEDKRKAQEMYDQQNAETRAKLDAFMAGQADLQKKHDVELEQVRGQVDLDRRVLDMAIQKLRSYEEAKERYDRTHGELSKKAADYEKKITDWQVELEEILKELKFATETEKAIKMYVSFSFDEALEAIGNKATKIIRCIPNTKNATIQFEGTKETAKGVVREEVNAVISVDGETGIPIKSLSGGERTAVDLAVDLAVIDYIESKTGKGMNLFILDEPFDGLGTVEIEMALEVLKNANINKKLTIVDHNPEVKEMVKDRLVVVRDGLTSKVA